MSLMFFIFLFLLAVCFYFVKWRQTCRLIFIILVALFLFIGTGLIPHLLLENLQKKYSQNPDINWQENNAIILLGAGAQKIRNNAEPAFFSYGRILEVTRQYYNCQSNGKNCKIILSGGGSFKNKVSEAEVYKKVLTELGVDANDIILESKSMNTWQNALFTNKILKSNSFDNIILLSSGFHMLRSELYFAHFGIKAIPVRADYIKAQLTFIPTWYNFALTDIALHEYIGYIRYFIYNFMGWNSDKS